MSDRAANSYDVGLTIFALARHDLKSYVLGPDHSCRCGFATVVRLRINPKRAPGDRNDKKSPHYTTISLIFVFFVFL